MSRPSLLIVGGGPAGICTALFLVEAAPEFAERVVVVEKEHYPREKFCAGALGRRADTLLGSIGVTVDVPQVPIGGIAVRAMGETRVVRTPRIGRVVRRAEFDHALAEAARRRGIVVREGVRVTGVDVALRGVTVRTAAENIEADVVVGADGVGSVVRRAAGIAANPHVAQAIEVDTEPVARDLERDLLSFDFTRRDLRGYYWDFPTIVDGRALVCRGVYLLKRRDGEVGPEIDDILAEELATRGLDLGNYRKKRYAERGFWPKSAVSRPRVLLVGEAAGIDPVTGEGIAQAVQYGAAAGRYLARKLRANDADFSDWGRAVRRHSIGRDLSVRTRAVELAYGTHRPTVERFLLDTPEFMTVGLQHFAGQAWSKRAVARAAMSALGVVARELVFSSTRASTRLP